MKTIEQLEHELKEIQQQIEKLKKVDDFKIKSNFRIDEDFFPREEHGILFHFKNLEYFNHFEIREQSEKIGKKFNAYLKLWHIAQHLNEGWEPNWNNLLENRYTLMYKNNSRKIIVGTDISSKLFSVYFKNIELAGEAVKMMGEESLKDYFL